MAEEITKVDMDDILAAHVAGVEHSTQQPTPPENTNDIDEELEIKPQVQEIEDKQEASDEYNTSDEPQEEKKASIETDEYGNPKNSKVYSEDEVNQRINEAIRDRLSRLERNTQMPTPQQQQQAASSGFEYNAESDATWQQQLESFVEQTVSRMAQKQAVQTQQQREQQAQIEFEQKFHQSKAKFTDFHEVVGSQPITDAMVMAARGMKDPAAFFYAASKRAPQEIERISRIADPYAQVMEIGKLEEKMKAQRPTTKTPKPISKTNEDSVIVQKSKTAKENDIDALIAQDSARRLAIQNQKRRR